MSAIFQSHTANAPAIIAAVLRGQARGKHKLKLDRRCLQRLNQYQRYLCAQFGEVITKPSFDYISKKRDDWLIVGDHRGEIAGDIRLIIERHGIGIGMLVLHLQQLRAGHILTRVVADRRGQSLAKPTECLHGVHGENILSIPIRKFRSDFKSLAGLNIAKPRKAWKQDRIITHERDQNPCFYCSCPEINPAEVVVDIDGPRHGLSRNYTLGFTFAPFGNPLTVVHFLAWDRAHNPLNMNRTPVTVSDLVKLTQQINLSVRNFFAETEVRDYPILDGISNGWAGNTIYHQHFQFYQPEWPAPVVRARPVVGAPIIHRDDVRIQRLQWASPVYRIRADDSLNTGLVGNDLAGIWRLLGGSRKVPYKPFRDGYKPAESERVPAHTQNLYVPGGFLGTTAFLLLRDRELINFNPKARSPSKRSEEFPLHPKHNIGVLEATGTLIVDDRKAFKQMKRWAPRDISRQLQQTIAAVTPELEKVAEFEASVRDLYPQ